MSFCCWLWATAILLAMPTGSLAQHDAWMLVRLDGDVIGHTRTTESILADGHVVTRREQCLLVDGVTTRVALLVEEDEVGRVHRFEHRRLENGEVTRVEGRVEAERLHVSAGGDSFEGVWPADARGPAYWRARRAARMGDPAVAARRFTETEFWWEAGAAVRSEYQPLAREGELMRIRTRSSAWPGATLHCWLRADGSIERSSLTLPSGRERASMRCDPQTAFAETHPHVAPVLDLTVEGGVLHETGLGVHVAAPADFRWYDWSDWQGRLEAWARTPAGRRLSLSGRSVPADFEVEDLREALGADPILGVERQVGGYPGFLCKQGQDGHWGLAVLRRPHLLIARVDAGDDAAMHSLMELADTFSFDRQD